MAHNPINVVQRDPHKCNCGEHESRSPSKIVYSLIVVTVELTSTLSIVLALTLVTNDFSLRCSLQSTSNDCISRLGVGFIRIETLPTSTHHPTSEIVHRLRTTQPLSRTLRYSYRPASCAAREPKRPQPEALSPSDPSKPTEIQDVLQQRSKLRGVSRTSKGGDWDSKSKQQQQHTG